MCRNHQNWIRSLPQSTTDDAIALYFALKIRGVPAELEKFDGFKHIDIAIPEVRVNLEIDGGHHVFNSHQALADLKRTFHSFRRGFLTLRIPNALVREHLDEAADYIVGFLMENQSRQRSFNGYYRRRY
ncbi:MAG: hypothetical protein GC192_09600 [Bacteroidetes bacterium]|nr:hypothetical protein [Bacteroidota bacterium]